MIFVVDTNILFSACLTPSGKIFDILFEASPSVQFISSTYAVLEITRHKPKLIKLSGLSDNEIESLITVIYSQVAFYTDDQIEKHNWIEADRLTRDVDSKDISFVAMALQNESYLWTGDKKLANHLKNHGFEKVLYTAEVAEMLNID